MYLYFIKSAWLFTMDLKKYFLSVFVLVSLTDAIKVNMKGSLNLGKEVMDTVSYYMRKHSLNPSHRRSMPYSEDSDVVYFLIKSTYLCRDLDFCEGDLEEFLNEYIMILTKSIEAMFEGIIYDKENVDDKSQIVNLIFEDELKKCLRVLRKLMKHTNIKMKQSNYVFVWIELIKKISIMFQTAAIMFAIERLEGSQQAVNEVKKKITQKLVIAMTMVEGKYEMKLCADYNICAKSYECTKALDVLLGTFKDMENDNVKIFIRYVSEGILHSGFYSILTEVTSNELQIILNDMAYSANVPTKEVLSSIHKIVKDRLRGIAKKEYTLYGRDVELLLAILSDMDHMYSKRTVDPFYIFMTSFFEWSRSGSRLGQHIKLLFKDLAEQINELPEDLSMKLINEVRTFLELTVDPEIKS